MGRSTTRKAILKRKKECASCVYFEGNRTCGITGECQKGLSVTCYRQGKKCSCYKRYEERVQFSERRIYETKGN